MIQANVSLHLVLSIRYDPATTTPAAAQLEALAEVRKGVSARFRKKIPRRKIRADWDGLGRPALGYIAVAPTN